jgi:1,4-dihydroxy-2-naphthoate octaprenyltransferase
MSNLLSYLFTGMPADSSERSKRASLVLGYACVVVLILVMVLATSPSWPLAVGIVSACAALAYVAQLVIGPPTDGGP